MFYQNMIDLRNVSK